MIVFDEITADVRCAVLEQYLSPLSIVNDHWTGDEVEFYSGSLRETFSASERQFREIQCPSFWASIGTHLLVQLIWGRSKGLYYLPGGERNAPALWKNCRLDTLAVHVEPREAEAGDTVYRSGFISAPAKVRVRLKRPGARGSFSRDLSSWTGN